jgi:hypothetical protein
MEKDDAEKVIKIILEADGGCEYCVARLLGLFNDEFSEHKDIANKAFRDKFGTEIEDFLNPSHKEHRR